MGEQAGQLRKAFRTAVVRTDEGFLAGMNPYVSLQVNVLPECFATVGVGAAPVAGAIAPMPALAAGAWPLFGAAFMPTGTRPCCKGRGARHGRGRLRRAWHDLRDRSIMHGQCAPGGPTCARQYHGCRRNRGPIPGAGWLQVFFHHEAGSACSCYRTG